ncbi:hypothetical protein D9M68_377070 [compost metagenome]
MVRVAAVVQGVGDVGLVRVALLEGHRHFGAGDQRQVQAVHVAGVGPRQAQPAAFLAGLPAVAVEEEVDPVAAFEVDVAVGVVLLWAGHPRRQGAGDARLLGHLGTEADILRIGDGVEAHLEAAVPRGAGLELGDDGPRGEGLGGIALDLEHLARRQGGAAADPAEAGLLVEVTLVVQARVEVAALALQVFVQGQRVAQHGVGIGVVVGLAVDGAGAAGQVDLAIEVGVGVAVIVGAAADQLFDHPVAGLQPPDRVGAAAAQAGQRAQRQADVELVVALVVMELHHFDAQPVVAAKAVPDADLGEQALDELKVALAVLHDLPTPRVLARQGEEEVLAEEAVAATEDAFDDLRHRLLLINTVLVTTRQQRQAWLQGDLVVGFVDGAGQPGEAGDHAIQGAQGHHGRHCAEHGHLLRGGVQAEFGIAAEQLRGLDVAGRTGEFDAVAEGLAQGLLALEGQHVQRRSVAADLQAVAAVVEEGAGRIEHGLRPPLRSARTPGHR